MLLHSALHCFLAQSPRVAVSVPPTAGAALDWTQWITVIGVGLLIAFGLQLLLFSLGSAIALSIVPLPGGQTDHETEHSSTGSMPLGAIAGFGTLSTVNLGLFVASFVAIALMHLNDPFTGAIGGIVLWAVYCGLVIWLSLNTVNTWRETALNGVTAGLRRMFTWLTNTLQPQSDQQPLTAPQIQSLIRDEIQTALTALSAQPQPHPSSSSDQSAPFTPYVVSTTVEQPVVQSAWHQIQTYLTQSSLKKLTPKHLDRALQKVMDELPEPFPVAFDHLDPNELIAILQARHDLSPKQQKRILQHIQTVWETHTDRGSSPAAPDHRVPTPPPASPDSPGTPALPATIAAIGEQVVPQLPELWQRHWTKLAPLATAVTQTSLKEAIAPLQEVLNTGDVQQQLEQVFEQSQSGIQDLNQTVTHQAAHLRDRATDQLTEWQETVQQVAETRFKEMRQAAQTQLAATRKILAITAWWIFATLLTGGISAAVAGAIAAGFQPLALLR